MISMRNIKVYLNAVRSWRLLVLLCLLAFTVYQFSGTTQQRTISFLPVRETKPDQPWRILVTGTAGFIGHHVAKRLATTSNSLIIGLDNFNSYYDVRLKIDRAYALQKLGVVTYNDDLCTQQLLEELFTQHNFTHVVHLAAQAGVRYSLKDPLSYIHSNVECQLALLDTLTNYKHTKLIYASSSSVYGKAASVPFRLSDPTDQPGNMYAATKKTDEMLGLHYCQVHGLTTVGLRFFTVYGPWGRPDMAVFKFAEAIIENKELPLFQKDDDEPLERDFTYIDDVVDGVLATMSYTPRECGERFNLGYGHPLSVPRLVGYLEQELGVKANVKMLPIPPSEILKTWADISTSTHLLGFNPKVHLQEGVRRFAKWYKDYRAVREEEDKVGEFTDAHRWFKQLHDEREARSERYKKQWVKFHNERLEKKLSHEKEKYVEWAHDHGKSTPKANKQTFSFFQGMNASGGNILEIPTLKNDIEELKERCKRLDQCVAFTSDGVIKDTVSLKHQWTAASAFTEPMQGLYVADMDVCKAELHECSKYADCTPILPGQYECKCRPGYSGDGKTCLHNYGHFTRDHMEKEFFEDYFNIFNVTQMKQTKSLIFMPNMDSPGGDYMMASGFSTNLTQLKHICHHDPICIGVTSDGVLKRRIQPKDKWVRVKDKPKTGFFLYDIDYCLLDESGCPEHAECQRRGPADYRCACEPGYKLSSSGECRKPVVILGHTL